MAVHPPARIDVSPVAPLRALTYRVSDVAVIAIEGRLDASAAPELDRTLSRELHEGCRMVVLDVHQLHSLEPDALDVLWIGLRAAMRRGVTLAIAGLRSALAPAVEPLVPHGLRVHSTIRSAISAPRIPDGES